MTELQTDLPPKPVQNPRGPGRPVLPYAVAACSLVFFWSIYSRALIYTLMPTMATDLGLSAAEAGFVISSMLLGYCVGGWASGWLPGTRKARIVSGVALSLPATAWITQATGFDTAMSAALVMGLGIGLYLPLGMALLVEVGRDGRGAAYMSVHELAATLASFAGSVAVAVLLARTDWHGAILICLPIGVLATISFLAVKDPEGDRRKSARVREPVPLDVRTISCVLVYAVGAMLVMGIVSMLPLIMVNAWALDQGEAASAVGYTRLAGLIGVAGVGLAADRMGHGRFLIGLQMTALAGLLIMSLDGYGPVFIAGVLLLAIGASGNITLASVVVAEAFPLGQRERVMAYSTGPGGFLGMVVAPALFGLMLDAGMPTGPILVAAGATLVAIVLTAVIVRRGRHSVNTPA